MLQERSPQKSSSTPSFADTLKEALNEELEISDHNSRIPSMKVENPPYMIT
jgi:hypothetical protein